MNRWLITGYYMLVCVSYDSHVYRGGQVLDGHFKENLHHHGIGEQLVALNGVPIPEKVSEQYPRHGINGSFILCITEKKSTFAETLNNFAN